MHCLGEGGRPAPALRREGRTLGHHSMMSNRKPLEMSSAPAAGPTPAPATPGSAPGRAAEPRSARHRSGRRPAGPAVAHGRPERPGDRREPGLSMHRAVTKTLADDAVERRVAALRDRPTPTLPRGPVAEPGAGSLVTVRTPPSETRRSDPLESLRNPAGRTGTGPAVSGHVFRTIRRNGKVTLRPPFRKAWPCAAK